MGRSIKIFKHVECLESTPNLEPIGFEATRTCLRFLRSFRVQNEFRISRRPGTTIGPNGLRLGRQRKRCPSLETRRLLYQLAKANEKFVRRVDKRGRIERVDWYMVPHRARPESQSSGILRAGPVSGSNASQRVPPRIQGRSNETNGNVGLARSMRQGSASQAEERYPPRQRPSLDIDHWEQASSFSESERSSTYRSNAFSNFNSASTGLPVAYYDRKPVRYDSQSPEHPFEGEAAYDDERSDALGYATYVRDGMLEVFKVLREDLEDHRERMSDMRRTHERRHNPGLPDWSPTWTTEEFDIAHLQKAMRISMRISRFEARLRAFAKYCSKRDVRPVPWQDLVRPFLRNAYPLSWEQAWVRHAPRERIARWIDEMPMDPTDLAGHIPLRSGSNPVAYADEHPVEYPSEIELCIEPDLNPGDSHSRDGNLNLVLLADEGETDIRIRDFPGKPTPWGMNDEVRLKMESIYSDIALRSHMV